MADTVTAAPVWVAVLSLVLSALAIGLSYLRLRFDQQDTHRALRTIRKILDLTPGPTPFYIIKFHLSGHSDDELRKLIVLAGGIRVMCDGRDEAWRRVGRFQRLTVASVYQRNASIDRAFPSLSDLMG